MNAELQRKHRVHPFTQVRNSLLEDKRLSWEARGLLAYLLSKPSNWTVRIGDLLNKSPAGRDAVYTILRELKAAGYLEYCRQRDDDGAWHSRYIYDEVPSHWNELPARKQDFPLLTDTENPDRLADTDFPDGQTRTDSNTHGSNSSDEHSSSEGENAHTPDPSELTVREVRALELTDDEWRDLAEQEKGGKNRSGVLKHIESVLNRPPPAVEIVRKNTNRYPLAVLWDGIDRTVGQEESNLEFWDKVVKHWLACGWSPTNIKGMLEHYCDRRLPTTSNNRKRVAPAPYEPERKALDDEEGKEFRRQLGPKLRAKQERVRAMQEGVPVG